jgi:hypothetical protein
MAGVKSTPTESLVRVGDGRGFVVEERPGLCLYPKRYIITAAHCLPLDTRTIPLAEIKPLLRAVLIEA